ncbi:MAG: hypothetical protein HY960_14015 [Ignavibacteriae bacterium]|nr:hypothetical protein [Ignavibacteriota bacterium]
MKYNSFFLIALIAMGSFSCHGVTDEMLRTEVVPKIVYWMNGGVSGRTDTVLIVNSNGVATSRFGYPTIDRVLADSEYQSIISLFNGFDTLSESDFYIKARCRDQQYDHIVLINDTSAKMVSIDLCSFGMDSTSVAVNRIRNLRNVLWNLSKTIYKEDNPWRGVTVQYSTNKSVYHLNEPIQINILIKNPTDVVRTLYFFYHQRFTFSIGGTTPPYFLFHYPKPGSIDETKSTLILQPNSQHEITYEWDYESDTSITLAPTKYRISLDLLAGQYNYEFRLDEPLMIEITERMK